MDHGRAAVAAAEEMAFGGTRLDDPLDRAAVERALADIVAGPWWASCGPAAALTTPRRDARSSSTRDSTRGVEVRLASGQLSLATVAHELAHALAGTNHGHDGTFRAAYVDVVAMLAGAGCASALVDALGTMGVAPGTRRWPPPHRGLGDGFLIAPA
jgi:hypothetical protein